jgi:hypothetical protein
MPEWASASISATVAATAARIWSSRCSAVKKKRSRAARLRFFFTAEHTEEQIRAAVAATVAEMEALAHSGIGLKAAAALAKATRGNTAPGR